MASHPHHGTGGDDRGAAAGNSAEIGWTLGILVDGPASGTVDSGGDELGPDQAVNRSRNVRPRTSSATLTAPPDAIQVRARISCEAVGPSGIALLSQSICDARNDGRWIDVDRVTVVIRAVRP